AYQDPRIASRFPEIPLKRFESAVQLIGTDGRVWQGAEAAFCARAANPRRRGALWLYESLPGFATVAEFFYRFVAAHRKTFSFLTRLGWGDQVEVPQHFLTRWIFLRGLGIIYLIAFLSLWTQISGLIGSHGILPAADLM